MDEPLRDSVVDIFSCRKVECGRNLPGLGDIVVALHLHERFGIHGHHREIHKEVAPFRIDCSSDDHLILHDVSEPRYQHRIAHTSSNRLGLSHRLWLPSISAHNEHCSDDRIFFASAKSIYAFLSFRFAITTRSGLAMKIDE